MRSHRTSGPKRSRLHRRSRPAISIRSRLPQSGTLPQDIRGQVRQRLGELRLNFDYLVEEQKALGYSDNQGTRKRLDDAAAQVEQLISDGMQSALGGSERDWLMLALLMMRRYEAQYRFDRNPATWELFFKSYRSFERSFQRSCSTIR